MKMKLYIIVAFTAILLFGNCQGKQRKTETTLKVNNENAIADSISTSGVQVVYFHNERRCATCMAVEEGASEVVKIMADSSVTFHSYLFGDATNAQLEKKLKVEGQSLLVVGKGQVVNFTNAAFLNARVKPETYKEELKAEIEKLK